MGKGWKNPHKAAAAQKKGMIFTKLAREIQVAAKLGGGDPDANARLKMAIVAARSQSCPKDTIDRAIKKGTGEGDEGVIEELTYEGYGPHCVGVIVECQTDNRNRTASNIRSIFGKNNGNMGESGSVAWMFARASLIEGKKSAVKDPEVDAIEVGANEVEKVSGEDDLYSFYGAPEDLDNIRKELQERDWEITTAELSYIPTNITDITEEQLAEVGKLLEALEDNDDTHRVYASINS